MDDFQDKLFNSWLRLVNNTVVPFLQSKQGMWITIFVIIWIAIY